MFNFLSRKQPLHFQVEQPIREEIFSQDRIEQYAVYLASKLSESPKRREGHSLLPRLEENYQCLVAAYKRLAESIQQEHSISPAGEWLIDNFHIIEDQVRQVREDLPERFYKELPKTDLGALSNYPSVYGIALALVAHQDSHIDIETVKRFLKKYQTVTPLLIGEIWAIPIVLRIALLENLRRLANQIVYVQEVKEWADFCADQIIADTEKSDKTPQDLIKEISDKLGHSQLSDSSVIVHLTKKFRDQSPKTQPACDWIDEYLESNELHIEQVVHTEYQRQAATQVTVSNIINSMRLLSNIDWQDFFERVNLVDPILDEDPASAYSSMDFSTRDRYRHVIERIHKKTNAGEVEIATEALNLAKMSEKRKDEDFHQHHVGYYLIEKGLLKLEEKFSYRPSLSENVRRLACNFPTPFYLSILLVLTLVILVPLLTYARWHHAPLWCLILIGIVALIPISDSCLNLLNLIVTRIIKPRILPKIDLKNGIPDHARTFVVVPSIFSKGEFVAKMLENIEICYLANQDKNLFFALLTDFADADAQTVPGDVEIVKLIQDGVDKLNSVYSDGFPKFYLFHRKRLWNKAENKWMGWERKRGKIREFNKFLRGATDTSFIVSPEYSDFFSQIDYVITLDADTKLTRDSARKLIGTILHPLNQPQFDPQFERVVSGYGILQPRISITPESSGRSLFARIFSGHTGIDPYTTAVSDVYQDLFSEGIYTGKGLYAVDSFEKSLSNRVPENALLSHDLFEGLFARTALVTDIEFLDDYPSHYESFAKRQHRWSRGDWQILPWLFSRVPSSDRGKVRPELRFVSRWKIFDNLRRSLVAPMTLLWLVLGWIILPGSAAVWTLITVAILAFPPYVHATNSLFLHPRGIPWTSHFWNVWGDILTNTAQIGLSILCLPHQVYLQTDAILRTLYRVYVSKNNLLEWQTAADVESGVSKKKGGGAHLIFFPLFVSVLIFLFIAFVKPQALFSAAPFLIAWMFFPYIILRVSRTITTAKISFSASEATQIRSMARRTWHFFETFVTENDNWLAPDNFQEDPKPTIAHRTSPTNMGLLLLSNCAAFDFGYIGSLELISRLEQTLATMVKLKRQFGHFYNWYNTETLEPLLPQYISTVDSGNLAGHLLVVKQTCLMLRKGPVISPQFSSGLKDTLMIVSEKLEELEPLLKRSREMKPDVLFLQMKECLELSPLGENATVDECRGYLLNVQKKITLLSNTIQNLVVDHGDEHYLGLNKWLSSALRMVTMSFQQLAEFQEKSKQETDLKFAERCKRLAKICNDLVLEMDFSVLFDKQQKIFTIGYNVTERKLDNSFYDLLASEARLASFVAIAKGDVPQSHWFHLGRQMTSLYRHRVLISWSASMFEYLMPLLVMRNYPDTILSETHLSSVKQQIAYGKIKRLPWGVSESAYNARDLQMNYQYRPFGVPGMGLKRGLSDDTVISPYSTALASMIMPHEALSNFKKLIEEDLLTDFGFYESVDYTKDRIPPGHDHAIVRNFMVHHQGMSLVAFDNILNDNIMQNRFHQDLMVRSSELLLQERTAQNVKITYPRAEEVHIEKSNFFEVQPTLRNIISVNTATPFTQTLSNGNYTVMLTVTGSGFSRCHNIALSRWIEDSTREQYGSYVFINDSLSDSPWSTTFQPMIQDASSYKATFSEHKAEFYCNKEDLVSHTEVIVSSENQVELKLLTLTNNSQEKRFVDVISYLEPILTSPDADMAHPAFSNLFIETEYIPSKSALFARRRRRSSSDPEIWGVHLVASNLENKVPIEFETSRSSFIGRGKTLSTPDAVTQNRPLSNRVGAVLDPCFSLKKQIFLEQGETVQLCFVSGVADSREEALRLVDQYHDIHSFEREDEMAWIQTQAELRHLNVKYTASDSYQQLSGALLYSSGPLRAKQSVLVKNRRPQSALWAYGISGDIPILFAQITNSHNLALIRQLLHAHEYLKLKNIQCDLVIYNAETGSYRQDLHEDILDQIRVVGQQGLLNKPGGIFVLRKGSVSEEDTMLLQAVARVYIDCERGNLEEQLKRLKLNQSPPAGEDQNKSFPVKKWRDQPLTIPKLLYSNGFGGFTDGGREYVIHLKEGETTPAPWINVIANSHEFGFIVSESGSSYTWSKNSRENRITPWSNDPVSDPSGEIFYIYDREYDLAWSPTPSPMRDSRPYLIRHGQGYTSFEHNRYEIGQELTMFCSMDKEIKVSRLKLTNKGDKTRKLSITGYTELVLGYHRAKTAHHIVTEQGEKPNIFLARNFYNEDFGERITFAAVSEDVTSFTCDRKSFLGRYRGYDNPTGIRQLDLGQKMGAGFDPCLALRIDVELPPHSEKELTFLLGQVEAAEAICPLVDHLFQSGVVAQELSEVKEFWDQNLNSLQVKTPYPEFDILINRWLPYQNLSCRIWARTAFYQSGGAYGFRDQLQDIMAVLHSAPEVARKHILVAAAHQFPQGDVLHWWHPPKDKGVRTHFSDDRLWLAYVVSCYTKVTGDFSVLDEVVPFVDGPDLPIEKEDMYFQPHQSEEEATLYEHCTRAIDISLKLGAHGLPLMGSGDWNDGMNLIGSKGKGESVWMAWFLISTLDSFHDLCLRRGDSSRIERYQAHIELLKEAVETTGWDGNWYLRAYFDEGEPVGSHKNSECKIDSITQSWAALSGHANPEHLKSALASVNENLVKEDEKLLLLFAPPFDKTPLDPGYIKGYTPGVRENGAQYTHAAVWAAMAFAVSNDGDQAFKLMSLLNPINHALTKEDAKVYKVEPYVIPADVYAAEGHVGQGGWTWYTGSAGWYYRAFTESILGIYREGESLKIKPNLPDSFDKYEVQYRFGSSTYQIYLNRSRGAAGQAMKMTMDGILLVAPLIPLSDSGETHKVTVEIFK